MIDIETRLREHLDEVATSAVPDAKSRRFVAVPPVVQFASHPGGRRLGRSMIAALSGLALAFAGVVLVHARNRDPSMLSVQVSNVDDRPGFIITDLPAGFDRGSRPKLIDPQNLAPGPETFETEFQEINGTGRVRIGQSLVPFSAANHAGSRAVLVGGVPRTVQTNDSVKSVVFPLGGRTVVLITTGVSDGVLETLANAVVPLSERKGFTIERLPPGWEGPLPTRPDLAQIDLATTTYRRGDSQIAVSWPLTPEWPAGEAPDVGTSFAIRHTSPVVTGFRVIDGYVRIDGTVVRISALNFSESELPALARSVRRATASEWGHIARQRAHAVGSEVAVGTIVKQGRVGSSAYRIVLTEGSIRELGKPGFMSGLVGVTGATSFATLDAVSQRQLGGSWGPDLVVLASPSSEQPVSATLSLNGTAPRTVRFLPAAEGQKVQFVFIEEPIAGKNGTVTVTRGSGSARRSEPRATIENGVVTFCFPFCPSPPT